MRSRQGKTIIACPCVPVLTVLRQVWLDPLETSDISMANSRQNIRRLVRDGLIIRKPPKIHSRSRVRARDLAKSKGRHTGPGKRKGKKVNIGCRLR